MTAKKKPAPKTPPEDRPLWRRHPWVSWSTLASIAAVIAVWPIVSPWIPRLLTAEAADRIVAELRAEDKKHEAEDKAEAARLRGEIQSATTRAERDRAWLMYGNSKLETLILRNKLNDCDPAKAKGQRERLDCVQYQREYDESYKRSTDLFNEARGKAK